MVIMGYPEADILLLGDYGCLWKCRASAVFIIFCLISAIVLYVTPFQVVAVLLGVYTMRHPRFRDPLPSVPLNLFKRLPSQADRIL